MTVAVACNLSEGVVLAVDSAVSVPTERGIVKVYENADKLFQLGDKPIGLAVFGLGGFGARSIGSYIREFEVTNPEKVVTVSVILRKLLRRCAPFFLRVYDEEVTPALEAETGRKFDQLSSQEIPVFGLVIGGFSSNSYLSEVWVTYIPLHRQPYSAQCQLGQGQFASAWYATYEPIRRYIKGYVPAMIDELFGFIQELRGESLEQAEAQKVLQILAKYEYVIPFAAMPMAEGVAHARFLVDLVINHHRFALGAPVVGGKARIGTVTYTGEKFQILSS
jgi:hypothetical protein